MDPGVCLRKGLAAVKDQECQRVIRVIAVLHQESSSKIALHGNQTKWWLGGVTLKPLRPAAAELTQPIEDDDSVFDLHGRLHSLRYVRGPDG